MKKILVALLVVATSFIIAMSSYAASNLNIYYNGKQIIFDENYVIKNNRTLVQIRPVAEALNLGITYTQESGTVVLFNEDAVVAFQNNSNIVNVNGENIEMEVPMLFHNGYSFVPLRYMVEPFNNKVEYNDRMKIISISQRLPYEVEEVIVEPEEPVIESNFEAVEEPKNNFIVDKNISTGSGKYDNVYFYQSQPDLGFENNGKGYCWVCSYAMLLTDTSNQLISPVEIAIFNVENGYNGNYMAGHHSVVKKFGMKLVPALSESSPYFGGFNLKGRGETSLNVTTDEDVKNALCEILNNFPNGVIVRYEGYPHSMVAVGYDENKNIYFNDPGIRTGEHVTFDRTCLKNYKLSDITFVQAVR